MFLKGVVDPGGQCVTAVLPRRVGTRCAKKSPTTLRQVPGGKSRLSKKSRICRDSWPRYPVPERVMKARGIIRIDEASTNCGKTKIRVGENMDCYVSYLMGRVLGNGRKKTRVKGRSAGQCCLDVSRTQQIRPQSIIHHHHPAEKNQGSMPGLSLKYRPRRQ